MFGLIIFVILGGVSLYAGLRWYNEGSRYRGWGNWCWCLGSIALIFAMAIPISWGVSITNQAEILAFCETVKDQPLTAMYAYPHSYESNIVVSIIATNPNAAKIVLLHRIQRINEKIAQYDAENESWLWDWYTYDWDSPGLIKYNIEQENTVKLIEGI